VKATFTLAAFVPEIVSVTVPVTVPVDPGAGGIEVFAIGDVSPASVVEAKYPMPRLAKVAQISVLSVKPAAVFACRMPLRRSRKLG
jgi:hypothetical protein